MKKTDWLLFSYFAFNLVLFAGVGFGNLFPKNGKNPFVPGINTDTMATLCMFMFAGMCGLAMYIIIIINKKPKS